MSVRDVIAQGPLKPPRDDNPVMSAEFECGCVGFAVPGAEGAWIVCDRQHVWLLEDLE